MCLCWIAASFAFHHSIAIAININKNLWIVCKNVIFSIKSSIVSICSKQSWNLAQWNCWKNIRNSNRILYDSKWELMRLMKTVILVTTVGMLKWEMIWSRQIFSLNYQTSVCVCVKRSQRRLANGIAWNSWMSERAKNVKHCHVDRNSSAWISSLTDKYAIFEPFLSPYAGFWLVFDAAAAAAALCLLMLIKPMPMLNIRAIFGCHCRGFSKYFPFILWHSSNSSSTSNVRGGNDF